MQAHFSRLRRMRSARKNQKNSNHKHQLREHFHRQIKRFWETEQFERSSFGPIYGKHIANDDDLVDAPTFYLDEIKKSYKKHGFTFAPFVTIEQDLSCAINVLFLRPDKPGDVFWGGDLDNRLKTLLDALSLPRDNEGYDKRVVQGDQNPFYCLLEEDKLITGFSVESHELLEPVGEDYSNHDVRLIISVELQSRLRTPHNASFVQFKA